MRFRRQFSTVYVASSAMEALWRFADASVPLETGGCLIGFRFGSDIVVASAIEIQNIAATPTSFHLTEEAKQQALDKALPELPSGHGYVGPWHSHPWGTGHSARDIRTIKRISRQYTDPVASVVFDVRTKQLDGMTAHRGRRRRAQVQMAEAGSFPPPYSSEENDDRTAIS